MTNKRLVKIATIEALKETKANFEKMLNTMAGEYSRKQIKIMLTDMTEEEVEMAVAETDMLLIQGKLAQASITVLENEIKNLEAELSEGIEEKKDEVGEFEEVMEFLKAILGL